MKAYRNPKTELLELRTFQDDDDKETRLRNSPLFKRFIGAVAQPNLSESDPLSRYWGMVLGEREDGLYTFFTEFSGTKAILDENMINWKDRLLIERFYASDEEEDFLQTLRKVDGLTRYNSHTDIAGRTVYEHKGETWPYFRDRDTKASILPVPLEVRGNLETGRALVKHLVDTKKAKVRWDCTVFESLIYQNPPYDRILRHPCMQAAIYAILMLERTKKRNTTTEKQERPVYGNLR
jgi:hypothetical protein